jgi:xylan 1,4-beta-xylosidase
MRLQALALAAMLAGTGALAQPAAITVDLNHKLGPYKPVYAWFGYDEANFTTGLRSCIIC